MSTEWFPLLAYWAGFSLLIFPSIMAVRAFIKGDDGLDPLDAWEETVAALMGFITCLLWPISLPIALLVVAYLRFVLPRVREREGRDE